MAHGAGLLIGEGTKGGQNVHLRQSCSGRCSFLRSLVDLVLRACLSFHQCSKPVGSLGRGLLLVLVMLFLRLFDVGAGGVAVPC